MTHELPADISQQIQAHIASGSYTSGDDVIRDALRALARELSDKAAIEAGARDMKAGRHRPFADVDRELRSKYDIPKEA